MLRKVKQKYCDHDYELVCKYYLPEWLGGHLDKIIVYCPMCKHRKAVKDWEYNEILNIKEIDNKYRASIAAQKLTRKGEGHGIRNVDQKG